MGEYQRLEHTFPPVYNEKSQILILGSFPSVKSRELEFFYGHPQNRFWKVLSLVLEKELPETVTQKKQFLFDNHIALWDVIQSCDIIGSSDASIKNVITTDLSEIINHSQVRHIFVNGKTAERLYHKYSEKKIGKKAIGLPSTSPANAGFSLERLCEKWKVIREYISS